MKQPFRTTARRIALGGIALALLGGAAQAQAPRPAAPAPAAQGCRPPQDSGYTGLRFFLDIEPTDGILDVWCRLQALTGKYRVNVWFPETNAHRTFETTFDGRMSRPREELAAFIQSLIPTDPDAPAQDEQGQPFPAVLEKTVQALAPKTPDDQGLGLPPRFPGAKSLALWESVILRVRPVVIGDKEFVLSVLLTPRVGRLLMDLHGQSERFVLRASRKKVMPFSLLGSCPDLIPDCKDLPETLNLHTAWVVGGVKLEAAGGDLSKATQTLFTLLGQRSPAFVRKNSIGEFSFTKGDAVIEAEDGIREMLGEATGDPQEAAGTQSVVVRWRERANEKSYGALLADWATRTRGQLLVTYGAGPKAAPKP